MHCIKRLGERVMSRIFERQVNELHIRAAILNRLTELGRPQRQPWPSYGRSTARILSAYEYMDHLLIVRVFVSPFVDHNYSHKRDFNQRPFSSNHHWLESDKTSTSLA